MCYITEYSEFKKFRNIDDFQKRVVSKNNMLKSLFDEAKMDFDKPLTISQISFDSKPLIEDHIVMCGDSAGMIHPLCGNGMSMAIQGAKIASELIVQYFEGGLSREELERAYKKRWNRSFRLRIKTGKGLARLFRMKSLALYMMNSLTIHPKIQIWKIN